MATVKDVTGAIRKQPSKRYLAYIRSPRWAQRRREHFLYCGGWCEICRWRKAMQVHHVTYARLGFEHPLDLTAVCVQCHHEIHIAVFDPPANDNEPQLSLAL